MSLLGFVHPDVYIIKVLDLILGCLILGIGVYMEVLADVVMLPEESSARAIVFHRKWQKARTVSLWEDALVHC